MILFGCRPAVHVDQPTSGPWPLPRDNVMKARRPSHAKRSRGAILPLTAIALVGLCGFVALAVDVGMLAIARAQAQDAADAAAVAGAACSFGTAPTGSNLTGATAITTPPPRRRETPDSRDDAPDWQQRGRRPARRLSRYNYGSQTFSLRSSRRERMRITTSPR